MRLSDLVREQAPDLPGGPTSRQRVEPSEFVLPQRSLHKAASPLVQESACADWNASAQDGIPGDYQAANAVKGNWADYSPIVSFSNPLPIFGVLIYDLIHITVERVVTGKVHSVKERQDYVGKDHLHYRLERALGSRQAGVAMMFLLTICPGLSAMALCHAGLQEAVLLLVQAGLLVAMIPLLEVSGRSR